MVPHLGRFGNGQRIIGGLAAVNLILFLEHFGRRRLSGLGVVAATLAPAAMQNAEAATAAPLRTKPPNILFFFPDQQRFDWVGWNPELPVRTPNLDALARRGVRFNKALCPSPLCAPSRSIVASGRDYENWVRLCYTSAPPEAVERAAEKLAKRMR